MCVIVVKHDKNVNPDHAKSRIVVLGNFEEPEFAAVRFSVENVPSSKHDSVPFWFANRLSPTTTQRRP